MTERRAHWTDELIYEVFRIMDGYALEEHRGNRRHGTPTYDIIAAVEDWQEQEKTRCKSDTAYHCTTHDTQWLDDESDRCEYKRMVDAEAAIERVRALHKVCTETPLKEGGCGPGYCDEPICAHDAQVWPCLTIRALEGHHDDYV